jgi:hypothetical protein
MVCCYFSVTPFCYTLSVAIDQPGMGSARLMFHSLWRITIIEGKADMNSQPSVGIVAKWVVRDKHCILYFERIRRVCASDG